MKKQFLRIPSLVIMGLWASVRGSRMIIFLAGLQDVPAELLEAAEIDGAGSPYSVPNPANRLSQCALRFIGLRDVSPRGASSFGHSRPEPALCRTTDFGT